MMGKIELLKNKCKADLEMYKVLLEEIVNASSVCRDEHELSLINNEYTYCVGRITYLNRRLKILEKLS